MTHPSSLDLEAFACGEVSSAPKVAEHLEECPACSAFVERVSALVAPTAAEADALIARALATVAPSMERERERTERQASVTPITAKQDRATEAKPPAGKAAKVGKGRLWLLTTSVITPLAAAAAILLLARSTPQPRKPSAPFSTSTSTAPAPPDTIQIAPFPRASHEPDTTFKGGMQIAVVRDRGGEQARFASGVRVRPGDRLRVEVALDREQAIVGAVLADDGSYLELMPLAVRGPGTHFSEKSAKIDASPTFGTIVIGTPEAVARARATRQLDGVATLRVESEGSP
jgi:hypothetical protein